LTREEAKQLTIHLRHALSHLELALDVTASLSDRDQVSSLKNTLKSASADIIADALAPIFQLYPELRPETLFLEDD